MPVQMEFSTKPFDQMFETFRKAAESTLEAQQNLFRQWTIAWPQWATGQPFPKLQPPWFEQFEQYCKEWTQATGDVTRKNLEICERQYKAGLEYLENAFKVGETKDPAELRKKMEELWQKSFECLKELAETQMKSFQAAVEKWMDLVKKAQ
jgi:hypothetical protein